MKEKTMVYRSKLHHFLIIFAFLFLSFFYLYPISTSAEEASVIRVGYCPLQGYHAEDTAGNMSGYEIDYLDKIAERMGWTYEFIEAPSWSDAVEMLRSGEIDLLSPAQITEERSAEFSFSSMPMGKIYGAVAVLPTNQTAYEDFSSFSDMVFGVEEGVSFHEAFLDYAKENQFTPTIRVFPSHDAMFEALCSGKIDAMATNIMRVQNGLKLLGRFGTSSSYFMFRKDDADFEEALNFALYKIDLDFPNYQNDLIDQYFPIYSMDFLTKTETDYIESLGELTIGCPSYMDPISYLDEDTGEITGISRDILDLAASRVGLTFRYKALPEGPITYDYLRDNGIDIISCVEYNSTNANSRGMNLTLPYLNSQKVLIGRKGDVYVKEDPLTLALHTGSVTLQTVVHSLYPNYEIKLYNSMDACMKAVKTKEADIFLDNQYTVESYLAKPQYSQLAIIPSEGMPEQMCLSPITMQDPQTQDPLLSDSRLVSVLNKGIKSVTQEEISKIIIYHTIDRPYEFVFKDFVYQYRFSIGILLLLIVCALTGAAGFMNYRRKALKLLLKSEKRLMNITNNINGGVIVLLPDEGFRITYANEGFLELIQYSKEEFDSLNNSSYTMYVHKDDLPAINDIVRKDCVQDQQISLRLRILRRDGTYIPTRFNGTVTLGENRSVELYCVIMDISQEADMLASLELEQKKHNLIIEKTNEIIYELDLDTNLIQVSDAFRAILGWTLSKAFPTQDIGAWAKSWKVHPEDAGELSRMLHTSIVEKKDDVCSIRLEDREGIYRWFRIAHYTMQGMKGEVLLIIGKITDIDQEMQEKLRLTEKSQLDTATGLYNKETFLYLCAQFLVNSPKSQSALLFLDLDHFKMINDLLGHITGDKAIMDAASKLDALFHDIAFLSRFGGDEFCLLIRDITEPELKARLQTALTALRHTYGDRQHTVTITASIGAALCGSHGATISELLENADKALYAVKENGKNNYMIYHEGIELKGYHGRR